MKCVPHRPAWVLLALASLAALAQANGTTPSGLDAAARARLRELRSPGLEELRAGVPPLRGELGPADRERLRQAEQRSPRLEDLRAGMSDHDLLIIIAVAVVIIALIAIF